VPSYETLLYEESDDGVATVTLNRPEVLNAFNLKMREELQHLWKFLRGHDDVRAVILTGAGEKAWCTGIDRHESLENYGSDSASARGDSDAEIGTRGGPYMFNDPGQCINPKENDFWKPVIAAVNGMACGGALYMLGEVDIIIAAEHATFFDPHVTYGMVDGFEAMHLLQKLPLGETLRVALLGGLERMSAQRAHQLGLVSEICPKQELMERAMWVASAIASAPPIAIQGTLKAIWTANDIGRRNALAQAASIVMLGTVSDNLAAGQETFKSGKREWRLR
jgi:enoyl-CoA hydratase/carnithine racemase